MTNWPALGGLLAGLLAFGRPTRLRPSSGRRGRGPGDDGAAGSDRPAVVVIVPARDEADRLPELLAGLPDASSAPIRTIVVDDHSTDDTVERALASGVEVIRAPDPPSGWAGKPWACHRGVARLENEPDDTVVVFLDADVRVEPGAIDALIERRAGVGGVVSIAPHHDVPTAVEQASALFNIVQVMGIGAGTKRPRGLFGPVICATLGDIRLVGGHASVHDRIVEDLALAERFREHGVDIRVLVGGLFRIRMYEGGLGALWRGWSKNFAIGARHTPLLRRLLVAWWIAGLIGISTDLAIALTNPGARRPAILAHLLAAGVVGLLARRVGSFRLGTALLFPLALVVFLGVFTTSLWSTHVRRRVTWRGRTTTLPAGFAAGRSTLGDGGR